MQKTQAGAELWEERKRHEQAMGTLRKRLAESDVRERELQERMERRERHIEQLSRELQQLQEGRLLIDGDRMKAALRKWREEKAEMERRMGVLGEERKALEDKCNETMLRMEALAKAI